MSMRDDIRKELLPKLKSDFQWKTDRGEWLRGGKCPDCGEKQVYTNAESPWVLKCNRQERCGYEETVRDRYPDLFDTWSNRFKQTRENPTAAADAYLMDARKLNLMGMRGAYSQEWFQDHKRNIGSATVRFPLPGGSWWERLIDQPGRFEKKANFAYGKPYKGQAWQRPDVTIEDMARADSIWFAEGIFNAWALEQAGQRAASTMSCNNYPEEFLKQVATACAATETPFKRPKLIFAYDAGGAGTKACREHVGLAIKAGWDAGAAQPMGDDDFGKARDWNDLLGLDRLTDAHRKDYLWYGDVLLAPSAQDKAYLLWDRHRWNSFNFTYNSRTYWCSIDAATVQEKIEDYRQAKTRKLEDIDREEEQAIRLAASREALMIEEIANCAFRVLYRQRDDATDETKFFLNITFPGKRPPIKGDFTAPQLRKASNFEDRLFAFGGVWTGSAFQLTRILQHQTPDLPDVRPLGFTGYCRDAQAYVFGDIAVANGRVYKPNDNEFFQIGKQALKLGTSERLLDIDYDADQLDTSWLADLWTAYGAKGVVCLTFYFASLFAEQIRGEMKSFPFLEMHGLPGTGKTTLIEFLWKLMGRENYEGFDPAKATPAAMARNLGKVGNLPVVLIEGDRREEASHARKFEWEELKTAYNGRTVRSRGVKNGGMETFEPPFRGAIVIEQNEPVNASRAVLERIMSLGFDMSNFTPDSKVSAERLEQWPVEKISGFIVHAARRESDVMARFRQAFAQYEQELLDMPAIRTNRLAKTHGQLLAFLDAMRAIVPLDDNQQAETAKFIVQMAADRQLAVNSEDPIVTLFWTRFDYLEENEAPSALAGHINHHRRWEDGMIAVRLNEMEARCAEKRLELPSHAELIRALKTSKQRRFVEQSAIINSRNEGTGSVRCWIFHDASRSTAKHA
ncbi:toprim domain-containing protein [Sphingobium yanoikuyae]|uniref:Bifunctional DNA primase/helicase n=1 Tax=Sphingobium yanoikuyae TaxID=13690 RepID=A0A291N6C1_SPHYA|nr:toprim domain-containing protein [Sphingobium yanoikuyae]ATI82886.1 bifunctional DNA primase/helicase [Sphingobium yanoikuyae]